MEITDETPKWLLQMEDSERARVWRESEARVASERAMRRHVKDRDPIVPGYNTIQLDEQVQVPMRDAWAVLIPGLYFIKEWDTDMAVCTLTFFMDDKTAAIAANHGDLSDVIGKAIVKPVEVGGENVLLYDVMTGYVIQDEGLEEAKRIFHDLHETLRQIADKAAEDADLPMVLKAGRQITGAMEASNKARDKYEGPDGGEFTMAPNGVKLSVPEIGMLNLDTGTKKTLAWLDHLATVSGYGYKPGVNCIVNTTVDEILEARGLEPTKRRRERVRQELRTLGHFNFDWTDDKGEHHIPFSAGYHLYRGGRVTFNITDECMGAILNSRRAQLPLNPALMRTDDKSNPNAWVIGYTLMSHSYMNKDKPNECTLSVEKLLDHLTGIPKPEDISGRDYTHKIMEPLERDLNALYPDVLEWWDYCHEKGECLTDDEQAARLDERGNDKALPYEIAKDVNIQWKLTKEYEDHMEKVMASRDKRAAEAELRKHQAEEKQKRIERKTESAIARNRAKEAAEQSKDEAKARRGRRARNPKK